MSGCGHVMWVERRRKGGRGAGETVTTTRQGQVMQGDPGRPETRTRSLVAGNWWLGGGVRMCSLGPLWRLGPVALVVVVVFVFFCFFVWGFYFFRVFLSNVIISRFFFRYFLADFSFRCDYSRFVFSTVLYTILVL